MIVEGYKGFNSNKTNRYGTSFEEGKIYKIDGDISFGNTGNGFHMCTSLADVFRYFDNDVVVAKVIGYGNTVCYNDEYNGYYNMYAVSNLLIRYFLTREQIIETMLNTSYFECEKFLKTFKLNDLEKQLFLSKYQNDYYMTKLILYYQYNYLDVYKKDSNIKEITRKLI